MWKQTPGAVTAEHCSLSPWEEAESLSSAFCSRSSLLLFHYCISVSPDYSAEWLLPRCSFKAQNSTAVSTACILNLIPVLPLKSGLRLACWFPCNCLAFGPTVHCISEQPSSEPLTATRLGQRTIGNLSHLEKTNQQERICVHFCKLVIMDGVAPPLASRFDSRLL